MPEDPNEILTVAEAAAYLRRSEKSVRDWLREGKIPGAKLGNAWRIRKSDLDALFSRGPAPATPPEGEKAGLAPALA